MFEFEEIFKAYFPNMQMSQLILIACISAIMTGIGAMLIAWSFTSSIFGGIKEKK